MLQREIIQRLSDRRASPFEKVPRHAKSATQSGDKKNRRIFQGRFP
jgi:hypothetical protein